MNTDHRKPMATIRVIAALLWIPVASAHDMQPATPSATLSTAAQAGPFGQPGVSSNVTRTIAISMTDNMIFRPDHLTVRQGETVRLRITNIGKLPHEFVLGTRQELTEHAAMMRKMPNMVHTDASSARVAPGKSADIVWRFSKPGKFLYACLIPGHWEAGMQGSVTVTAPVKR